MDSVQRFCSRADDYARYRPGYPQAAISLLRERGAMTPLSVIADFGAGTGRFTRLLVEQGNWVYAVEPNAEMRQAAGSALAGFANLRLVAAPAEATGLEDASVDLVSAAQCAHWFDIPRARLEIRRILKPGGWLLLIWNIRRPDSTPFLREYEALLTGLATGYQAIHGRQINPDRVRELFAPDTFECITMENWQQFDCEGLLGRTISSSYTPLPGDPNHEPLMNGLRELFARHQRDGRVTFEYDTRLYLGPLSRIG